MATVNVTVRSDLEPSRAWKLASDLSRFDEWLTIFAGWRSPVPDKLEEGTEVSSCIRVKGFRNTIHWTISRYDEPHVIELTGRGWPAVRIKILMTVTDCRPGSEFHLVADLSGGVLNGPIGRFVAKLMDSDVRKSVENLAALS